MYARRNGQPRPLSLDALSGAKRRPHSLFSTTTASRRLLLWLAPLLFITSLLLWTSPLLSEPWHWPTDSRVPHRFARPPPYFPPPGHLKEWVAEEEERYQVAVADRWDLVRQYGPHLDDLQSSVQPWCSRQNVDIDDD